MPVGKTSMVPGVMVLMPFIILFATVFYNGQPFTIPSQSFAQTSFSAGGMALYTIMWNFIGWDNTTT